MAVNKAICAEAQWEVWEDVCTTQGAEGERVYGIACRMGEEITRYRDVSANREEAQELCRRLTRTRPSPVHIEDIIADFIEETETYHFA